MLKHRTPTWLRVRPAGENNSGQSVKRTFDVAGCWRNMAWNGRRKSGRSLAPGERISYFTAGFRNT